MSLTTFDMSRFTASLRAVQAATKRDGADVVNRALKNVAFRAASFTPKGSPAVIEGELRRDKLALKIVTKRLRGRIGTSTPYVTKKGKHAMRTVKRVTRRQIAKAARELINRRKKVVGYMRAGWIPAIKAFGGSIRGERPKSSLAVLGSAKKATPAKILGEIVNHVYGKMKGRAQGVSKARMHAALAQAVRFVAKDEAAYARKKMSQTMRKLTHR